MYHWGYYWEDARAIIGIIGANVVIYINIYNDFLFF